MTALGMYNTDTGLALCHPGHIILTFPNLAFGSFGDYFEYHSQGVPIWGGNTDRILPEAGNNAMFSLVDDSDDTIIFCHGNSKFATSEPAGLGVIEKINHRGEIQWQYGGSRTVQGAEYWHMQYLPNGNIVAVGLLEDATHNIAIIDTDGNEIQTLKAVLKDQEQPLIRVAVDYENNSFVVIGEQENLNTDIDIIFYYTWNSSTEEYEEEWTSGVATGLDGRAVSILSNGDLAVGFKFKDESATFEANWTTYILNRTNGSVIDKFRVFGAVWDEHDGVGMGFYWKPNAANYTKEILFDTDGGTSFYVSQRNDFFKYSWNGSTWEPDVEVTLPSGYILPRDWSQTWTKQKYFCRVNNPSSLYAVFNTADDTFEELYTNSVPRGVGIHKASARLGGPPKIMTTGSGHTYPLFTPDNATFIDNTIPKGYPELGDVPGNNYSDGDIVVMDKFRRRTNYSSSPFQISSVAEALKDGNYGGDTGHDQYPDARRWLKYSETGPEPIQGINTYTGTDNVVLHEGSYYKAIDNDSHELANYPPNATYWTPVSAPDQKWDDFDGYGGSGYRAPTPSLSPQVYTLVFSDIKDESNDPHLANGVYHCVKHYSTREEYYTTGRYRFDTMGWLGAKNKLRVEYNSQYDDTGDELFETIITFTLVNYDIPQWEAGSYDENDFVQHNGTFYRSGFDDNTTEPPSGEWETLSGRPTGSIFEKTFDNTVSYGSVMSDDLVANEFTDTTTFGHNGTVSFYPGKYTLWRSTKPYSIGAKATFDSDFFIALIANLNSEPVDGAMWTKQN